MAVGRLQAARQHVQQKTVARDVKHGFRGRGGLGTLAQQSKVFNNSFNCVLDTDCALAPQAQAGELVHEVKFKGMQDQGDNHQ